MWSKDLTEKGISKALDFVTTKVGLRKIKALKSNPQVKKVLLKRGKELVDSQSCVILSNIIAGSGVK